MSWFTRKPPMTFEEELEEAVRYCTAPRFSSLQENDQSRGYHRLWLAIREYAISLEEEEDHNDL